MRNSLLCICGLALAAFAQPDVPLDPQTAFRVNLPSGAPVVLVSADWGSSRASARGGALWVDLHSSLLLRNASPRRLRGVSLQVLAQELAPGGKAAVTVPALDVQPGDTFPIRIDLRLMRPLAPGNGPLVEVGLDGVLFEDLTFYGPNKLNARRVLVTWELEARRDRRALTAALEHGGPEGLRKQLLAALARQSTQPRLDMQVARLLPSTNVDPGRSAEVACLQLPEAPVELLSGSAKLTATEARLPHIEVQNRSKRSIRYLELGWLVRDSQGRELLAGTLPAELSLNPGQRSAIHKESALRFPRPVSALAAYPAVVEFDNGEIWVPSREALRDPRLEQVLPPSGEEQRLAELYRRKGLEAVIGLLKSLR